MKALLSFFLITATLILRPPEIGWDIFARVRFSPKFVKEADEYFLFPVFQHEIRALEGKQITLTGHYIPYDLPDKSAVVISKYPYSACFFCGAAGPESVAEIRLASKCPRLKADQRITVTGTLKLNDTDINHLNFILQHAVVKTG